MTFIERELRTILTPLKLKVVYVGTSAYIPLPDVKIRIDFSDRGYADHFDKLCVQAINPKTSVVDTNYIRFADLWGHKRDGRFPTPIKPHIWRYTLAHPPKFEWYGYTPTESDYKSLRAEVKKYIDIYC